MSVGLRTRQGSSPLQARVRKGIDHPGATEWEVYDPEDNALIAVRYSFDAAVSLMDGYNLGARAQLLTAARAE